MKQIKAKNEVKKAKTKGKQEGEEVMKNLHTFFLVCAILKLEIFYDYDRRT